MSELKPTQLRNVQCLFKDCSDSHKIFQWNAFVMHHRRQHGTENTYAYTVREFLDKNKETITCKKIDNFFIKKKRNISVFEFLRVLSLLHSKTFTLYLFLNAGNFG